MPKSWSLGLELVDRKTCEICKGRFYAPPAQVKRGGGRFCSYKCKGKNQSYWHSRFRISRPPRGKKQLAFKFGQSFIPEYKSCIACGAIFRVKRGTRGKLCSHKCWGRVATKMIGGYKHQRGKGGRREDLGDRYFRSRWEANYARYLNWLVVARDIQKWDYEVDTFEFSGIKRGSRFYTPDFKVWDKNGEIEYHEVKGWMDSKSQTKMKRMRKYHPNIRITIIDKPYYKSIARQLKSVIPNWETDKKHQ